MRTISLSERKRAAAERQARAAEELRERLRAYGAAHGGRFLLFGSAAKHCLRHDSDIDLLLDFPDPELARAWRFVEAQCRELHVRPDVMPLAWCDDAFVAHVMGHAETIP